MTGNVSIAKKRPLIIAFKASLFSLTILGSLFFLPHAASAFSATRIFPTFTGNVLSTISCTASGYNINQYYTTGTGGTPYADTVAGLTSMVSDWMGAGVSSGNYEGRYPGSCASHIGYDFSGNISTNTYILMIVPLDYDDWPLDTVSQDVDYFTIEVSGSNIVAVNPDLYSPPVDYSTHIATVTPPDSTTPVATSTAFTLGATGYVNSNDLSSSTDVHIVYTPNVGTACYGGVDVIEAFPSLYQNSSIPCSQDTLDFPVTSSGAFSLSTTTNVQTIGTYTMTTSIQDTSYAVSFLGINLFGSTNTLFSTSTTFLVVAPSALENSAAAIGGAINGLQGVFDSASTTLNACNPLGGSFSIATCTTALFVPTNGEMKSTVSNLQNNLFSIAPIGYITRAVVILTSSTTIPLPNVSFTFSNSGAVPAALQGKVFEFDPWQYFYNGSSTVLKEAVSDTPVPENVWQLIEPAEWIILWLALAFMIIRDLTHIHQHSGETPPHK